MAEITSAGGLPPNRQADEHYQKGLSLKSSGDLDAALTEFRRAALLNPDHFEALLESGRLCKLRAKSEPIYFRHTFEAFRQAARLNLTHTEAHDEYITAAQKLDRLDEILKEYDAWIKFNPDNPLLARCRKNILTISMALMPDTNTSVAGSGSSKGSRKMAIVLFVFILGLTAVLLGVMLLLKKKQPGFVPRDVPRDVEVVN